MDYLRSKQCVCRGKIGNEANGILVKPKEERVKKEIAINQIREEEVSINQIREEEVSNDLGKPLVLAKKGGQLGLLYLDKTLGKEDKTSKIKISRAQNRDRRENHQIR